MSIRNGGKIIAGFGGSGGGNGDSLNNQNPTSPIRQVYDWIGTLEEYEAQQVAELHPTWVCFILDDTTPKDKNLYTNRNVGDIFFTTRLDLLLNGAVECDGNTYSFEDFTGEQSIGNLLKNGKIPYVSLSQYASLLTNNGVVGVFGWDGGNNTNFRVPTLENIFVEAGNTNNIGEFTTAGLPNITGCMGNTDSSSTTSTGCFYRSGTSGQLQNAGGDPDPNVYFDASRSNSIYGNSDTVQPKSIKYRAMVQLSIGFTDEAVEKCMNVVNDVAELKEQQPHNLTDSMITNCITNIPQDIKLEINSNKELVVKAGTKFNIPNGINNFDIVIIEQDTVVFNGTNTGDLFVSYEPNPPTEEVRFTITQINKTSSGSSDDKAGEAYHLWYDTTNNIVKKYTGDGTTAYNSSFPLCIINSTNGLVNSIKQVFNGFGFIGTVVYALPGVKGLMPYGRNEDGTLRNKEIELNSVSVRDVGAGNGICILALNKNKGIGVHWETSGQTYGYVYDREKNYYYTTQPHEVFEDSIRLKLGTVVGDGTRIVSIDLKYTLQVVDYNETKIIVESMLPTSANNYTWYRKYSDGWVEQGGTNLSLDANGALCTVNLPIAMANENYTVIYQAGTTSRQWATNQVVNPQILNKTTTSFSCIDNLYNNTKANWQVSGIAAK